MKQDEMIDHLNKVNTFTWNREAVEALTQAIDQLRWRKVEDELPENSDSVLVMDGNLTEIAGWYGHDWILMCDCDSYIDSVTHWKPLPESP